jgi:restriction system protein
VKKLKGHEVNTAFEILLEEIEVVANNLNEEGAEAFKTGNYDLARRAIEEATRLADFHEKVKVLQKEWASLVSKQPRREVKARRSRKNRLPRGLRTPEDAFRRPILEALVELHGKAPIGKVLDLVGEKMKYILTKYDIQPLPSDPKSIRWRNTAQWCRNALVREGLMISDSPYGRWEISELGRKALQDESPLT